MGGPGRAGFPQRASLPFVWEWPSRWPSLPVSISTIDEERLATISSAEMRPCISAEANTPRTARLFASWWSPGTSECLSPWQSRRSRTASIASQTGPTLSSDGTAILARRLGRAALRWHGDAGCRAAILSLGGLLGWTAASAAGHDTCPARNAAFPGGGSCPEESRRRYAPLAAECPAAQEQPKARGPRCPARPVGCRPFKDRTRATRIRLLTDS